MRTDRMLIKADRFKSYRHRPQRPLSVAFRNCRNSLRDNSTHETDTPVREDQAGFGRVSAVAALEPSRARRSFTHSGKSGGFSSHVKSHRLISSFSPLVSVLRAAHRA